MKVKMTDGKHTVEVEPVDKKELMASGYTEVGKEPKKEVVKRVRKKSVDAISTDTGETTA